MASRLWQGLIVLAGAALLIGTTTTAVIAMINDRPDPAPAATRQALDEQGSAAAAAVCARGATNCSDTVVDGEGGLTQCAADGCAELDKCAQYAECAEPGWSPVEVFSCEPGQTYEQCFPNGAPPNYDCVTQESDPIVVACKGVACEPMGGGDGEDIRILPAPAEDLPLEILPAPAAGGTPIDPGAVDPPVAQGEAGSASGGCAPPAVCEGGPAVDCGPIECVPGPAVDCAPIDPCTPSSPPELQEGGPATSGIAQPACLPVDPCSISKDVECLPPDCSVSSDGAIACPEAPTPCVAAEAPDGAERAEPNCAGSEPSGGSGGGSASTPPASLR